MDRSSAEATNVSIDQVVGLMAGSMPIYCFRKRGVEVAINVGSEELRNVMGMRCSGVSHAGESVRTVACNDLGPWSVGVRISRVLAASIGASRRAERVVAAVAIRTVAAGEVETRTEESDMLAKLDQAISFSATPKTAAKKLRKNVSHVRSRTV